MALLGSVVAYVMLATCALNAKPPHPGMQAALLPKLANLFPMEPGAKKGTTIQEQAITTAVLGVQC